MILRGLLERSLGGFTCIRGYAKLSDLARLSQSNKDYQRDVDEKHLKELEAYLDKREYVFFPEVTLSYTLNSLQDNISISSSNELLSLSSPKGKTLERNGSASHLILNVRSVRSRLDRRHAQQSVMADDLSVTNHLE